MIELDTARIERLDRLKKPPTHAVCASISLVWRADGAIPSFISADFHYGSLDGDKFVGDNSHGTQTLRLPVLLGQEPQLDEKLQARLLSELLSSADGKAEGDVRRLDIERLAAAYHPELFGTVE